MVFKKMQDSTQLGEKREYEECIDATVLARNILLRTHGFSPYQHVFGRDPALSFDVVVPGANVAAVTTPVLDRPSERDVVPGESSKLEIKLSSGEKAKVGECVLDTLAGMAEQLCRLCVLVRRNVWIAYKHQLLKVSQEQLRMATVTERVADDVHHQELRRGRRSGTAETSGHLERSATAIG